MNIELTATEARILRTLLEADIRKAGNSLAHFNALACLKIKTFFIPAEIKQDVKDYFFHEQSEQYTNSQRWGK